MLFSSSNITHIRRFLFIEAVRCLYIADFDLRCKFPSEKMSPVLHHYPHIKLPVRYFLWFHEDPWPWASRPCLRGSVGDNYYVSCMQICSAPGSTLTSTIIVSESLRPISTSRCSRSLTACEEVKVTVYTNSHVCIQICPDANDAPRSNTLSRDWKLISLCNWIRRWWILTNLSNISCWILYWQE